MKRVRQLPKLVLLISILSFAAAAHAQFRPYADTSLLHKSRPDSNSSLARGYGATSALTHSKPTVSDLAFQFLAGEVTFNATSFALWADDLYRDASKNEASGLGIVASMITVPLAIHFVSDLLHLKNGSWGWSMLGAACSFFLVTIPLGAHMHHPISYLDQYLILSLPLIGSAQAVYDFTIP